MYGVPDSTPVVETTTRRVFIMWWHYPRLRWAIHCTCMSSIQSVLPWSGKECWTWGDQWLIFKVCMSTGSKLHHGCWALCVPSSCPCENADHGQEQAMPSMCRWCSWSWYPTKQWRNLVLATTLENSMFWKYAHGLIGLVNQPHRTVQIELVIMSAADAN